MSRNIGIVTARAAFDVVPKTGKFAKLGDVQGLVHGNRPHAYSQGWSYRGDWKRKVAPVFYA
jgi:hypothetical protein